MPGDQGPRGIAGTPGNQGPVGFPVSVLKKDNLPESV